MSLVLGTQPSLRFSAAGPFGIQGVSYEPKVVLVEKAVTTTSTDDFLVVPAGTYLSEVIAVCTDACSADTEVTLGTDGNADEFITTTAFSVETLYNSAHFTTGYYFGAADTLRVSVGGTVAAGAVKFALVFYELGAMSEQGAHFDL